MSESRRIFIETQRLCLINSSNYFLSLTDKEAHYLRRVLRLGKGSEVNVVDGLGHLWNTNFWDNNLLKFSTTFDKPLDNQVGSRDILNSP